MADAATAAPPETEPHHSGHDHGHDHHEALAHHFEDLDQQFEAGKLGMWLFLAQEVLFFSGLFAAYAVYRWHHPEVFVDAHTHLNTTLGAVNTIVLLASSLAIAWGVRAAMRSDRRTILNTHVFTLGCAALFMGVKAIEYTHKWDEGIGAGDWYSYDPATHKGFNYWGDWTWGDYMPGLAIGSLVIGVLVALWGARWAGNNALVKGWVTGAIGVCIFSFGFGIVLAKGVMPTELELARAGGHDAHAVHDAGHSEGAIDGASATEASPHGDIAPIDHPSGEGLAEVDAAPDQVGEPAGAESGALNPNPIPRGELTDPGPDPGPEAPPAAEPPTRQPKFTEANFFSIYFVMTGVHAVHIVGGIIAILWVVGKAAAGEFDADYFLPVENVGLYWHLVDLVWIYLFPLMYLIH
ncbi:cytochrome c oxidase subunit 3 [Botrimarina sp.]|uniref:cytochrome c oxidase subunit 3 n=1 Tax=Botrimarina sp. TaxID=2795802 RepID=UPI0032ED26CC